MKDDRTTLQKLDALAADTGATPHEREVARTKAAELRKRGAPERPMPHDEVTDLLDRIFRQAGAGGGYQQAAQSQWQSAGMRQGLSGSGDPLGFLWEILGMGKCA